MSTVRLDLEEDLVALLYQLNQPVQQAARELIVLELYRRGAISSGKAAELLGMSRQEFILHASHLGIPYFAMTLDEWEAERKAVNPPPTVPNSSSLIALTQIGHLDLLEKLFTAILIPPVVTRETASSVVLPIWIGERSLTQPIGSRILRASLGPGEREAISLALEVDAQGIVLDETGAKIGQCLGPSCNRHAGNLACE